MFDFPFEGREVRVVKLNAPAPQPWARLRHALFAAGAVIACQMVMDHPQVMIVLSSAEGQFVFRRLEDALAHIARISQSPEPRVDYSLAA